MLLWASSIDLVLQLIWKNNVLCDSLKRYNVNDMMITLTGHKQGLNCNNRTDSKLISRVIQRILNCLCVDSINHAQGIIDRKDTTVIVIIVW